MKNFYKYKSIGLAAVGLAALAGLMTCATSPVRHLEFEQAIQDFVDAKVPGSELDLIGRRPLAGWQVYGFGKWTAADGVIACRRGMGYLATRCGDFADVIVTLQARVSEKGNSGVFFRAEHPGFGPRPWPVGYEAQIDHHDAKNPTGSLYNRVTAKPGLSRDREWFDLRIEAVGGRIRIYVNQTKTVDTDDFAHRKGFIALQAHDPFTTVEFRDIRVRIPARDPDTTVGGE